MSTVSFSCRSRTRSQCWAGESRWWAGAGSEFRPKERRRRGGASGTSLLGPAGSMDASNSRKRPAGVKMLQEEEQHAVAEPAAEPCGSGDGPAQVGRQQGFDSTWFGGGGEFSWERVCLGSLPLLMAGPRLRSFEVQRGFGLLWNTGVIW